MFDGLQFLFFYIIEIVLFMAGGIMLIYAFYSISIQGFDKAVRIFLIIAGILLISIGIAFHF